MLNVLVRLERFVMSDLKYCQGSQCHMYETKDRLKGQKGNKTYQTRRRSNLYYGNGNFCSLNCQNDWFRTHGDQAINHFGRLTEPRKLEEKNAWVKDYDWNSDYNNRTYVIRNGITREQRPITREQFNDTNYTLNENKLNG